jgi:DNA-binding FrmR family transcriptional regulator
MKSKSPATVASPAVVVSEIHARLSRRVARLEGQVKALGRMLGQGDWKKMLVLAAAIEGAADQVTADLFEGYLSSLLGGKEIGTEARKMLDVVLKRL